MISIVLLVLAVSTILCIMLVVSIVRRNRRTRTASDWHGEPALSPRDLRQDEQSKYVEGIYRSGPSEEGRSKR